MTIAELIEKLKDLPPDMVVLVDDRESYDYEAAELLELVTVWRRETPWPDRPGFSIVSYAVARTKEEQAVSFKALLLV